MCRDTPQASNLEDLMLITRRRDADMKHAWDELVGMLTSARDNTMDQAKSRFSDAQESVADTGWEARRRLANAAGALAGRPAPPRWGLIATAGAVGAIVGASAIVAAARFLRSRRTHMATELPMVGSDEVLSPAEREQILNATTRK
jgi:hypothetical protein